MRALLFLLVVLGLAPTPLRAEHAHEGSHVRVRGEVPEAWIETAVALGDALYPVLVKHLGRAPEAAELPLRLVMHPDRRAYSRALKKAGVRVPLGRSGGFTFWKEGVSHVYLQGEAFHSRRLILHELAHQLHAKCRPPSRRGQGAWWYREGLAEYYGWHRRTREGVAFGQVHPLTRAGTAREALACVKRVGFSAWRVLTGAEKADYAHALAVVAPLLDGRDEDLRARFRAWEREILERGGDTRAFTRHFSGTAERLEAAVRAFWLDHRATWSARAGSWAEERGVIVGQRGAGPAILMRAAKARAHLKVHLTLDASPGASAGLLLDLGTSALAAVVDGRRMVLLLRSGSETASAWREVGGRAFGAEGAISLRLSLVPAGAPSGQGEVVVRAQAGGDASVLRVPGAQAGTRKGRAAGQPGLFVRHGGATFRDFGFGPGPK